MARGKKSAKREKRKPSVPPPTKTKRKRIFPLLEDLPFRYQLLIGVFILIVAICVLYPELVFQNKIFMAGDTRAAASFGAAAKQLPAGNPNYPMWNPFLFAGMPSYDSLSYLPYIYPLSQVLRVVRKLLPLPESSWLLSHIFLLGLGVFLLLKDRGIVFSIAIAAGCLMMWMPNLVAVGANGHGSQVWAVAYMPFALLFWDRMWRGKGILLNGSVLAIILGFQMLGAHLQICYYTYALIGLHMIFFSVLRVMDAARGRVADESTGPVLVLHSSDEAGGQSHSAALVKVVVFVFVLALVVFASLLICSVLYLPVHDYSQYSVRGASEGGGLDYNYATSWSLHPAEMLTFLLPHAFGFGKDLYYGYMPFTDYPNYLGLIIILGAIGAVLWARNRFTNFLVFIIAVSTLVSFGKFFPLLYEPLFKLLPFFNKFRVPVMVLIVQQLAVVCLFAIGLNALLKMESDRLRKGAWWMMLGSFAVFLVVILSQGYWREGFAESIAGRIGSRIRAPSVQYALSLAQTAGRLLGNDLLKFSIILSSAFLLLFLYTKRVITKGIFVGVLVVLCFFDFYLVNRYIIHPERFRGSHHFLIVREKESYDAYLQPDPVVSFLQKQERFFRILPINNNPANPATPFSGDFLSNRYMNSGISSIGGYHAAKLANYQEYLTSLGRALSIGRFQMLDMLNVRYLVASYPLQESDLFVSRWEGQNSDGERRYIYENLRAFPRVFFVDSYRVAEGKRALDLLLTSDIDVSKTAVLAKQPSIEPVSSEGSRAEISNYYLNEIHVNAHVDSACLLVLSEVYYPRWRVFINDAPGEIIQANHILRAVALPPGDHNIVFRYDATLFYRGLLISVFTFVILVLTIIVSGILGVRRKARWMLSS